MIQVSKEKIRFSMNDEAKFKDGDPRKVPLEFDLLSAHVCPKCNVLAQALYLTDDRMQEKTVEHFGADKPMRPAKFAFSTPGHQVTPQYKSLLITAGGRKAELLREECHFNLAGTVISGQCGARRPVYFPGKFDLPRYLLGMTKIVASTEWFQISSELWVKVRSALTGPSKDANAEQMFNVLKSRIHVAKDVTGRGSELWLLGKGDWGYSTLSTAIAGLPEKGKEL